MSYLAAHEGVHSTARTLEELLGEERLRMKEEAVPLVHARELQRSPQLPCCSSSGRRWSELP